VFSAACAACQSRSADAPGRRWGGKGVACARHASRALKRRVYRRAAPCTTAAACWQRRRGYRCDSARKRSRTRRGSTSSVSIVHRSANVACMPPAVHICRPAAASESNGRKHRKNSAQQPEEGRIDAAPWTGHAVVNQQKKCNDVHGTTRMVRRGGKRV